MENHGRTEEMRKFQLSDHAKKNENDKTKVSSTREVTSF
jgi:hypothetical protein